MFMFWFANEEIMGAWMRADEIERQSKLLVLAGLYMASSGTTGMDGFICMYFSTLSGKRISWRTAGTAIAESLTSSPRG